MNSFSSWPILLGHAPGIAKLCFADRGRRWSVANRRMTKLELGHERKQSSNFSTRPIVSLTPNAFLNSTVLFFTKWAAGICKKISPIAEKKASHQKKDTPTDKKRTAKAKKATGSGKKGATNVKKIACHWKKMGHCASMLRAVFTLSGGADLCSAPAGEGRAAFPC